MLRYPAMIEMPTRGTAFGIAVPDLPGCYSAGNTIDDAMANARNAIALWIGLAIDEGRSIPPPSTIADLIALPLYQGWTPAIINIEETALDETLEIVSVALPKRVLHRLDNYARRAGVSKDTCITRLILLAASTDGDVI